MALAGVALDIAALLYQARQERGLSQTAAAAKARMRQQAVSRLEKALGNMQLATVQRYLDALGYSVGITVKDKATGAIIGTTTLSA